MLSIIFLRVVCELLYPMFMYGHVQANERAYIYIYIYIYDSIARFLPDINNERVEAQNETYKRNFASLRQLIMVRALQDNQVRLCLPKHIYIYIYVYTRL
jgi:hypothetical protein